jgi:tRNA A37 threonylcarbamoyladenosine dehydratase
MESALDLLAVLRAEAAVPETILIAVMGQAPTAIYPNDIIGKTDDELLALVRARLAEHNPKARE